jgi:hypothetical protein
LASLRFRDCGRCLFPVLREDKAQDLRKMNSFHSCTVFYIIGESLFFFRCLLCSHVYDPHFHQVRNGKGREHVNRVNSAAAGMFVTSTGGRGYKHFNSVVGQNKLMQSIEMAENHAVKKEIKEFSCSFNWWRYTWPSMGPTGLKQQVEQTMLFSLMALIKPAGKHWAGSCLNHKLSAERQPHSISLLDSIASTPNMHVRSMASEVRTHPMGSGTFLRMVSPQSARPITGGWSQDSVSQPAAISISRPEQGLAGV